MRCHDVIRYMSLFLDSELSPETNLEMVEHLEQCPSCAARIDQERQLEGRMRDLLLRSTREDDVVWERVLSRATRPARDRMLRWRKISAVGIAVSLCTLLLVVLLPRAHHEMDLARSTNSDHARFLEETQEEELSPANLDQLRQVASRTLQGAPPIPESTPPDLRLLRVGRCTLDGAPVAYLILATKSEPASLFLMDRAELQRFPDAAALLAQQPAGVTCQVGDRSFFMRGTSSVVACGIGHMEPDALRDLVHWLLPY